MIQTKIICDRCKEREGKSVVFYRTRERDASGSIDCVPHTGWLMTDEQITRMAGELVMGWKLIKLPIGGGTFGQWYGGEKFAANVCDWQPLTDWRSAGEVIERMRVLGWYCSILCMEQGKNLCEFHRPKLFGADEGREEYYDTPTRAIVLAAIRAMGGVV